MKTDNKTSVIKLKLDNKIYPTEAIVGAAYMFLDRAYLFLDSKTASSTEVNIKSKEKIPPLKLEELKDEFLNELLFYSERLAAAKRNKKVREFIVGKALFSAIEEFDPVDMGGVQKNCNCDEDDPLGILGSQN